MMNAWDNGYEAGLTEGAKRAHAAAINKSVARKTYEELVIESSEKTNGDEE
jgi:hypothetical protein